LTVTGNASATNFLGTLANGNSNVRVATSNGNVTIAAVGNTTMTITGTGANIAGYANISANANVGNIGGTGAVFTTLGGSLTTAAQPNITSVGTLTSLAVTGNISVTGQLTSTIASGTAPFVVTSNTQVANLSVASAGSATSATTAGTVTTAAQPNITSLGTLTGLTLSNAATISVGSNTNVGTFTGNFSLSAGSRLNATYADLAERYVSDQQYEPGTVVVFGGKFEVTISNAFDSHSAAGVVSTNPAYLMNSACEGEHVIDLALSGRVPVLVQGSVSKGDLMVTGPNGRAVSNNMARAGTIIGKSLENFTGDFGVIEVVIGKS